MRFFSFIFIGFVTFFLLVGCSKKEDTQDKNIESKTKVDEITYPITLKTMENKEINVSKIDQGFRFSAANNEAVLVNFFATWCPPCRAEIPHLNNLHDQYKEKLKIISIVMEDKEIGEIEEFIKEYDIKYMVTQGEANFKFAKAVGDVKAIPFMILYDKNGKYATHYVGAIPQEMLDVDIEKVVQ